MRLSGLPYRLGHGERDRGQFDEPGYVFGACAAALYRKSLFEEVGHFDEVSSPTAKTATSASAPSLPGTVASTSPAPSYTTWKRLHRRQAQPDGDPARHAELLSLLVKDLPLSSVPHVLPSSLSGSSRVSLRPPRRALCGHTWRGLRGPGATCRSCERSG